MFRHLSSPVACALIAATGLHACLWWAWPSAGVAGGHDALEPLVADGTSEGVHVARMLVRADAPAYARPAQREVDASLLSTEDGVREESSTLVATDAGGAAWLSNSYFEPDQVERSPKPAYGWLLDEDVLAAVGRTHLLIKLWVSADGRIDHAEILQAEPTGKWIGRTLKLLHGTPMEPALRDGLPVAAITVVELQTENEQVR